MRIFPKANVTRLPPWGKIQDPKYTGSAKVLIGEFSSLLTVVLFLLFISVPSRSFTINAVILVIMLMCYKWIFSINYIQQGTLLLDPTDPLFLRVGRLFLQTLRRQFSPFVHHIFSADTFNEMQPISGDLNYLANVSRGVFDAMTGNYVVNIRHF